MFSHRRDCYLSLNQDLTLHIKMTYISYILTSSLSHHHLGRAVLKGPLQKQFTHTLSQSTRLGMLLSL